MMATKKKSSKKTPKATPAQKKKVEKVMHEFKEGELHSGGEDGPIVEDRDQAVAIALSEAGLSRNDKKSSSKKKSGSGGGKKS
jgi:hypothetical protein